MQVIATVGSDVLWGTMLLMLCMCAIYVGMWFKTDSNMFKEVHNMGNHAPKQSWSLFDYRVAAALNINP